MRTTPDLKTALLTFIACPGRQIGHQLRMAWTRKAEIDTRRATHPYRRFPTMIRSGNVPKTDQKGRNVVGRQRESPIFTPILPRGHNAALQYALRLLKYIQMR